MRTAGEANRNAGKVRGRRDRPIEADGSFGYATGRIRVRESSLLDRDALMRLAASASDAGDWNNALNQAGYPAAPSIRERMHRMLEENDRFLLEITGQTTLPRILLLEHDYHHLKVMLKTWLLSVRGDSETEASERDSGDLKSLLLTHDHLMREHAPTEIDRLASWLASRLAGQEPATEISEDLAAKVNAVLAELPSDAEIAAVDRRLDRAYYQHFQELAEDGGSGSYRDLLRDYLAIRADSANLQSMYRLRKAHGKPEDLDREWVPGGEITPDVLRDNFFKTEKEISEAVAQTRSPVADLGAESAFQRNEDWMRFSRDRDNRLVRLASNSFRTPYGPQIPFGYWFARQIEVRNLRLILAAADRGMETEDIEALLRADYRRIY